MSNNFDPFDDHNPNTSIRFDWRNFIPDKPIDLSKIKGLTIIDEITDFDGKQYDYLLERLKNEFR